MAEQLILDLPVRPAMGRGDFFVTSSNAAAVAQIDDTATWLHGKLVLSGPEGSGKTHLARVWATRTGAAVVDARDVSGAGVERLAQCPALVVEDVPAIAGNRTAETALFHLHNALAERGAPLLFTGRGAPSRWGIGLPDLESRLRQSGLAVLEPPDDTLLTALLVKLARDRALAVTPAIVSHVVPRIERSFTALQSFVERLDARVLAEKRTPRLSDARSVLAELDAPVSPSCQDEVSGSTP